MEEIMNTFGLDVKKLLIDKHMSQKELALLLKEILYKLTGEVLQ